MNTMSKKKMTTTVARASRRLQTNVKSQVKAQVKAIKQIGDELASTTDDGASVAEESHSLAPFVSVILVVVTLLAVVFCKMEIRRVGYSVLRLSHEDRQMRDRERLQMIQLAKMTRPERLQQVAERRLTMKKAESGQIIQMNEQGVAFREQKPELKAHLN